MKCDYEVLQSFLDEELDEQSNREVREHLAACRSCRRELARLRLLWLELAQPEEIPLPPELPYLRQQAIAATGPVVGERRVLVSGNCRSWPGVPWVLPPPTCPE